MAELQNLAGKVESDLSKSANIALDPATAPRSGGRILVDALRVHGTDRIFCVPGESYLDVLDALYDAPEIQLVVAKHEGAAANMAEADGKLTGRPGICFVTRGPGATQASVGVHTAFHDSTPMILFIGQVDSQVRGRQAFQEIDFRAMFAPLAKWVTEIESPEQIPECLLFAFQCATSGRPGPVVISLPEDVLGLTCSVPDTARFTAVQAAAKPGDVEAFRSALAASERPLMILGGSGWSEEGSAALQKFVAANRLATVASFRRQDLIDNDHPCYVGHLGLSLPPQLRNRIRSADLIVAFGTRLGELPMQGYTLLEPPRIPQQLIHVHADANELGRVYQTDLRIHAGPSLFAQALSDTAPIAAPPWSSQTEEARREFLQFTVVPQITTSKWVDLGAVVSYLSRRLPADATVSNGAGLYTGWVQRFYKYRQLRTELAPTSGAMGYGLPAAIASKLRHPDRISVCFAGDGCFLMYPQELATALQYHAAVIVLLVNNGMYGSIRMHQELRFPGRVSGTELPSPDFVALAQSFGAFAERVESTGAFADAFERAIDSRRPALLELCTDRQQITPDRRLP